MSFDGWLDARDSATLERAWATLGATRVQIGQWGPRALQILPHGAALLAASVLGGSPDRFAWWATDRNASPSSWPPPSFEAGHLVSRSFFDHEFELRQEACSEVWRIWETIEGARGVQHVMLDCSWGPMTREGGEGTSKTFVRVFDRRARTAVSIPLYSTVVWTVGALDLSPLDLFSHLATFRWQQHDLDSLRGLVAQLAADIDAHFDTSSAWPGGLVEDEVRPNGVRWRAYRFEAAPYAITVDECLVTEPWMVARVEGLPWGHQIAVRLDGADGRAELTLPRAQLEATLARLARIPGIEIGP